MRTVGASVNLSPAEIEADPGGLAICEVNIRNTGTVVDEFSVTVLGDATGWASIEPAVVSLFPGTEGKTTIRFRPPRSADTPGGSVPFAVRVRSQEDPEGSVVEEGNLEVGLFHDVFAELVPRASRGRRKAVHVIALDNRGNAPVNATLKAKDPNDLLLFDFEQPAITADPNTATFGKVKVKPRKRFLRGPARTHAFQVLVEGNGAGPSTADASMLQEPLMPRWLPTAILGLLCLALVWYALLKPEVKDAAREAVKDPLAEQNAALQAQTAEIAKLAGAQQATAAAAGAGAGGAAPGSTTGTTGAGTGAAGSTTPVARGAGLGTPFDRRLVVDAAPGTSDRKAYKIEKGKRFSLTDIVLQNPAGDAGDLEIRRNNDVILRTNLSNFRDLDYHFVSPVVFDAGQELVLFVQCANDGARCSAASYFNGFLGDKPA